MAEGLPEGFITSNDNVADEIQRLHEVDVEDVIRMWKAYSAARNILPDGTGQRLANFLWRVWGSEEILYNLTGTQLAAHFSAISEDGPLRTTPTQSPRASRNLSAVVRPPKPQSRIAPPPTDILDDRSSTPKPPATSQQAGQPNIMPPSILKKPQTSPQGSTTEEDGLDESTSSTTPVGKTIRSKVKARLTDSTNQPGTAGPSTKRADSETLPPGSTETPSLLESVSSEDTIKPTSEAAPKARRTKPVFSASGRKRPVTMKRKPSSNAPSTLSPRSDLPEDVISSSSAETGLAKGNGKSQAAQSPPNPLPPQRSLVDPNFRTKFVEKTRSAQSSFVNLPSLLRKPNPASPAAPASYQAAGVMDTAGRGRGKVTFTEGSKPPGPAGPEEGAEEEEGELPRTKSQLTLLLERDRRGG